jgi:penicillin-binding protein 1A
VIPLAVAQTIHSLLNGVVANGTGTAAGISGVDVAGKTGTTTNYGDAWFVGWTPAITTAVWVGFPNKLVPMTTLYNGGPVEGGTFPAVIWHNFMTSALQILASEQAASQARNQSRGAGTNTSGSTATQSSYGGTGTQTTPAPPAPTGGGTGTAPPAGGGGQGTTPAGGGGTTPAAGGGTTPAPGGTGGGGSGTGPSGGAGLGGGG